MGSIRTNKGVSESENCLVMSDSLLPYELYSPWNFPGQNTGVGSLSLLQGIFPTQILNPGCPHCRQILDQLSHQGSPWILEWVAYPFSRGSSQPRNRTGVSFIAGRFFTNWTIINKGVKNSLNHKWNRLDCSDRDGKGQKKNAVSLSCSSCTPGEKAFFFLFFGMKESNKDIPDCTFSILQ